ncbi:MAG: AMP-binding protein [Alphaproteobacteria bacterium]|nr:AMP-binding protein [Alphaproteobacteria bacterium]
MAKGTGSSKDHLWLKSYPKEIKWDTTFEGAPIYKLLEDSARAFPDRPCINFLGKVYLYKEVLEHVNRVAEGLQKLGVGRGTKVGLFMPNAPYYIFFYYGILKAGGTVVNFSPLYASREIAAQIEDSEAEIMVTLDLEALYPKLHEQLNQTRLQKIIVCPLKDCLPFPKNILFPIVKSKEIAKIQWNNRHVSYKDLTNNAGAPSDPKINPSEDVALLQYTGGTTGVPKGAMLTHTNVHVNAQQAEAWFIGIKKGEERVLAALPLFHVFAMTAVMNLSIREAAEIIMMFPRFNVDDAMHLLQKHKITFFPAVPTIYMLINNHPDVKKFNMSSLKACLSGGAPLPVEVKRQFESHTGCKLVEAYGLSETSPAALSNPIQGVSKAGSIGIPFPGTHVKIVSLSDRTVEVAQGEKGEICIQGPQVMKGYWKRAKETAESLIDGQFHTGDVGYMDKDGYVFLVDRIKDLIITNGYNVYPRHVEEAIYLHEAVEEVIVIGIPDPIKGEVAKAFVKLKVDSKLTTEELLAFLQDKLSPIELPKAIVFREALPKTIIGKLSKKELYEEEKSKNFAPKKAEANAAPLSSKGEAKKTVNKTSEKSPSKADVAKSAKNASAVKSAPKKTSVSKSQGEKPLAKSGADKPKSTKKKS